MPGTIHVRSAEPADVSEIHTMIGELASFEDLRHQFVATVDDLTESFFGETPVAGALVAEEGETGRLIGYAIWFTTFSTFLGKAGLWLEDLYVRPDWRGQGAGKQLLVAVAGEAKQRGSGRYEWNVLDWNQRAIDFYRAAGAEILPDWRVVRMDESGIARLSER
ncbi:MAG: GNAT family N-acetyltransferase [Verrucomicrobiae bacterium]|nr:GNAT family N-acetyltransferase [Verrucomicrobiae bacterium]